MKKILISLAIIAVVGAIGFGATRAYFSDTETSTGNTFTAGTIDLAVDSENPWQSSGQYVFGNLEPGDDEDINVTLRNAGSNDVVIWKKVKVTAETDIVQSEPECDAESGSWSGTACSGQTAKKDDISSQMVYSMKIGGSDNILKSWGVRVSDVNDLWIPIGKLAAGASLTVDQNYYFDTAAGNEYQGDQMSIDITFYADQVNAPGPVHTTRGLVLENKNTTSDWAPIIGDGIFGILTFNGSAYTVKAWGLVGATYQVAHYNESSSTQTLMGAVLTPVSGAVSAADTLTANGPDSKYWLRDLSWSNPNTLWESNLVDN
jgi:spore coat-associated protein N